MTKKLSQFKKGLLALGLAAVAASSHAALILDTPSVLDLNGTGVGNVSTILTISSPANSTTETGSVAWNGSATTTTGNVQSGGNSSVLNQAVTLATAGVNSAADLANLRIVFNAQEPGAGSGDNGINLNNLALSIFSPTGTSLFTSGTFAAQAFDATQTGTGNSGIVFKLDGADLAAATAALAGSNFSTNDRIGLSAAASNATGGFETFFAVNLRGGGSTGGGGTTGGGTAGNPVPEPATLAMLGLGMAALGAMRRRKG